TRPLDISRYKELRPFPVSSIACLTLTHAMSHLFFLGQYMADHKLKYSNEQATKKLHAHDEIEPGAEVITAR
ncbi:MAG: hypothetical protein E6736_17900, partial [Leclercia adecarboxylata]|nr:hypothetical protein [Leclercia adecarboxylata]